jgi:hypothetical protein
MRELFIYYRVHPQHAAQTRAALASMQSQLCRLHPGLTARRLCRIDAPQAADASTDSDALQTWMEIYAVDPLHQPGGITPELQRSIESHAVALRGMIEGDRHTEVFSACAS